MPRDDTHHDIAAPIMTGQGQVRPEWIDYNGHMLDASYSVVFSEATGDLLDHFGLGSAYAETTGGTIYTAEMHIRFLRELREGESFTCWTTVLGVDVKRLHVLHTMRNETTDAETASCELMLLHANHARHSVEPFPAEVLTRLRAVREAHDGVLRPNGLGRGVAPLITTGS